MTRKHFSAVAGIVRKHREVPRAWRDPADLAADLADWFAAANPRFNRAKFLEACEPDEA